MKILFSRNEHLMGRLMVSEGNDPIVSTEKNRTSESLLFSCQTLQSGISISTLARISFEMVHVLGSLWPMTFPWQDKLIYANVYTVTCVQDMIVHSVLLTIANLTLLDLQN